MSSPGGALARAGTLAAVAGIETKELMWLWRNV